MPVISDSEYCPPFWLRSGHLQTIFPSLIRHVKGTTHRRERIETPDGDFLDLDWNTENRSRRLVILCHGLEGDSRNHYVQGMAAACHDKGWDVLAWNFRGCSGEPNRLLRSYHSGATEDLESVIDHAKQSGLHDRIDLIGFSLGGNLVLKYLGDRGQEVDPSLGRAVALSTPCDLASSSKKLELPMNRLYMARFLKGLRVKIQEKISRFPGQVMDEGLSKMRTFREFDGAYTAPLHGFRSAEDYWERASCKPVLGKIAIPTLLLNAKNDPFLAPECFPFEEAQSNPHFYLEVPNSGGHLGFVSLNPENIYWSETRTIEFLSQD